MKMYIYICLILLLGTTGQAQNKIPLKKRLANLEDSVHYYPKHVELSLLTLNNNLLFSEKEEYLLEFNILQTFLHYHKGMPDSALALIKSTLPLAIEKHNFKIQSKCYLLLGWFEEGFGHWDQAIVNYYKCVELTKNMPCITLGNAYIGIARCSNILKKEKLPTLQLGLDIMQNKGSKPHKLFAKSSHIELVYPNNNDTPDKLISVAKKYLNIGLRNNAANIYKGIALIHYSNKEYCKAEKFVDLALTTIDDSYPGNNLKPGLLQFKAVIKYFTKDYNNSETIIYQAIKEYDRVNQPDRKHYAYKLLSRIDTIKNDYNAAFKHISIANKLQKNLVTKERSRKAQILEITYQVNELNKKVTTLSWQKKMITTASTCGIILLLFLLYYLRVKYKNKQRATRRKNRELQGLVVSMNEKLLFQRRLGIEIEPLPVNTRNFKTLDKHFDICYRETLTFFIQDFPELSKAEAKYALMFALGLSSDTICQIQSVQKAAIRMAKLRIRKKLDLDANSNLEVYFKPTFKKGIAFF